MLPHSRMPLMQQQMMGLDGRRDSEQKDFGFPESIDFDSFYTLYRRCGIASAVVDKIPDRCFESHPYVVEGDDEDDAHDKTSFESAVEELFGRTSFYERLHAADKRGRVGRYGALYLMFSDGQNTENPVKKGSKLLKVQPLYESQIEPESWCNDPSSIRFSLPEIYQYRPQQSGSFDLRRDLGAPKIHYTRLIMLSEGADDGGIDGRSALEPVYNDVLTIERIIGACGVGYWRSARGGLVIKGTPSGDGTDIVSGLAQMYGCEPDEVAEHLNENVYDFTSGMNSSLMLNHLTAEQLQFSLPDPQPFFDTALASIAAGSKTPSPALIGQQLSQRASDNNSEEFTRTCESRRRSFLTPVIRDAVDRLMEVGAIPRVEGYSISWPDLSTPSTDDKLASASKMSDINAKFASMSDVSPFTADEVREVAGYEPLEELYDDEGTEDTDPDYTEEQEAPDSDIPSPKAGKKGD